MKVGYLSTKKEAKLSAREIVGVEEGNGEVDLRCLRFARGTWDCHSLTG